MNALLIKNFSIIFLIKLWRHSRLAPGKCLGWRHATQFDSLTVPMARQNPNSKLGAGLDTPNIIQDSIQPSSIHYLLQPTHPQISQLFLFSSLNLIWIQIEERIRGK